MTPSDDGGGGRRAGRRYRSTRGFWTIPYVDETRLILLPHGFGAVASGIAVMVVGQLAGSCFAALGATGVALPDPLRALGHLSAVFPLVLYAWSPLLAILFSRVTPVRRRLVIDRSGGPGGRVTFSGSVDGDALAATTERRLIQTNLFGASRLWLFLGDRIIELWRTDPHAGGGHSRRANDWLMEHLSGGEGSLPDGPAEPGQGGVWLPALRSVRDVLQLGADDEDRVPGPGLPRPVWLLLLLLGMVMAAATVGVNTRIIPAISTGAGPAGALPVGFATGIALIAVELAFLRSVLRRTLVPLIDRFAKSLGTASRPR